MIVCAHILNVETNKRRKKIFVFIRICFDVFMIKCGLSFMHEKSADRHHNPGQAYHSLQSSTGKSAPMARLHDDWCLLFLSFRCGNLADVSNMSCKDGISPLCVAKVIKKLQLSKPLVLYKYYFR